MDIQNRRGIRAAASEAIARVSGGMQKTVLWFAGILAGMALLSTGSNFLMQHFWNQATGLSGLGLRSMLQTVQSLLPLIQALLVLGLTLGFRYSALRVSRLLATDPQDLREGFRRFGPLFRMTLIEVCIYVSLGMVAFYVGLQIFLMTPLSKNVLAIMTPILESASLLGPATPLDEATMAAITRASLPAIPVIGILALVLICPFYYQYRMASFVLLDNPGMGALAAMRASRAMMRRNRFNLFKVDLTFWWYFLLQVVIALVCYGDLLLPLIGVELALSPAVSFFLFFVLSLVLQVVVYYFCYYRIQVTYAICYDSLRPRPQQSNSVPLANIFDV